MTRFNRTQFNRRQILQAGLAAGTLALTARQAVAQGGTQDASQNLAQDILPQSEQDGLPIQPSQPPPAQAPVQSSPNLGSTTYDRAASGLLVRACGLAVAQFLFSRTNPDYDGSIASLAEYEPLFNRYRQVASFRAAEFSLGEAPETPEETLEAAQVANKLSGKAAPDSDVAISIREVFFGFALTSDTHSLIALRGTQTETEWLGNISSRQVNFRSGQSQLGRVHRGFQLSQERIITQVRRALPQLNPNLPLYITGHSLGGAVAMLTAADLALDNSFPARLLRIYTYGSPRVGDASFVQSYSRLVSQTYRVVNLADTVPVTPPPEFRGDAFQHVGQEWSFLSQLGATGLNHAIATYQTAIDRSVEVNQTRSYPISALS